MYMYVCVMAKPPSPQPRPEDLVLHVDLDACFAGRAPLRALEDWRCLVLLMAALYPELPKAFNEGIYLRLQTETLYDLRVIYMA